MPATTHRPRVARDTTHINESIRAPQVRLLDDDGTQLGVVELADALARALAADKDLVEIVPNAQPPVCKICDYSKLKYERDKKARASAKAQRVQNRQHEVKELRLGVKTGEHDFLTRTRQARSFLERGLKVKVTVRFRGREITHPEVARVLLDRFCAEVTDIAIIEQAPRMQGRDMAVLFAAKP